MSPNPVENMCSLMEGFHCRLCVGKYSENRFFAH